MAILLKNDSVFLHIPKTGGFWVSSILKSLDYIKENNNDHDDLLLIPEQFRDKVTFTTVRNPYTWFQSYWCMHLEINKPLRVKKKTYPSNDFNLFVDLLYKDFPNYLTNLYKSYMGDRFDKVNHILRFEDLESEFKKLLTNMGIGWNENVFKYTMKINRTYMKKPDYSPQMKKMVYNQEKEIFDFFGYGEH